MKALETPVRQPGELKGEFDARLVAFKADSIHNASKMHEQIEVYNKSKALFLQACDQMIAEAYTQRKRSEDYSDVIGSINTAIRSLSTVAADSTHFRSILLISDGAQDIPKSQAVQPMKEIPADIRLVTVNNSGSLNSVVTGISIEVDNLDRGLEKLLRVYKPLK